MTKVLLYKNIATNNLSKFRIGKLQYYFIDKADLRYLETVLA